MAFSVSGTLPLSVDEGSSYGFSIVSDAAVSSAVTIRWEIVPKGLLPVGAGDFVSGLSGSMEVASGTAANTPISISIDTSAVGSAAFDQNFLIRIYEQVGEGDTVGGESDDKLISEQDVVFVNVGDELPVRPEISVPATGDINFTTLGGLYDFDAAAGSGNDLYIITRYQYGDVTITDTAGDSMSDENIVRFEAGVSIKSIVDTYFSIGDDRTYTQSIITLSTDAVITIANPSSSFYKFQIGEESVTSYHDFRTQLARHGEATPVGIGLVTETISFAPEYTVKAPNSVTGLAQTPDEPSQTLLLNPTATSTDELVVMGSEFDFDAAAGSGNDLYIITRYQYGDVTITDTAGDSMSDENIVRFEAGVSIKSIVDTYFSIGDDRTYTQSIITLSTDAVITIANPSSSFYKFQIGEESVTSYHDFRTQLARHGEATPVGIGLVTETISFTTPYTVPFPNTADPRFVWRESEGDTKYGEEAIKDAFSSFPTMEGQTTNINISAPSINDLFSLSKKTGDGTIVALTGSDLATAKSNISVMVQVRIRGSEELITLTGAPQSAALDLQRPGNAAFVQKAGGLPTNFSGELEFIITYQFNHDSDASTDPLILTQTVTKTIMGESQTVNLNSAINGVAERALANEQEIAYFDNTSADANRRDKINPRLNPNSETDTSIHPEVWYYEEAGTTYIVAPGHSLTTGKFLAKLTHFTGRLSSDDFISGSVPTIKKLHLLAADTNSVTADNNEAEVFVFTTTPDGPVTITGFDTENDEIVFTATPRHIIKVSNDGTDTIIRIINGLADDESSETDDFLITLNGVTLTEADLDITGLASSIALQRPNRLPELDIESKDTDVETIDLKVFYQSDTLHNKINWVLSGQDGSIVVLNDGTIQIRLDNEGNVVSTGGTLTDTGLDFNSETGTITGMSNRGGIFNFRITAQDGGRDGKLTTTDDGNADIGHDFSLEIQAAPTAQDYVASEASIKEASPESLEYITGQTSPSDPFTNVNYYDGSPLNLAHFSGPAREIEFIEFEGLYRLYLSRKLDVPRFPRSGFSDIDRYGFPIFVNQANMEIDGPGWGLRAEETASVSITIPNTPKTVTSHFIRLTVTHVYDGIANDNVIGAENIRVAFVTKLTYRPGQEADYRHHFTIEDFGFDDDDDPNSFTKLLVKSATDARGRLLFDGKALSQSSLSANRDGFYSLSISDLSKLKFDNRFIDGALGFEFKVEDDTQQQSAARTYTVNFGGSIRTETIYAASDFNASTPLIVNGFDFSQDRIKLTDFDYSQFNLRLVKTGDTSTMLTANNGKSTTADYLEARTEQGVLRVTAPNIDLSEVGEFNFGARIVDMNDIRQPLEVNWIYRQYSDNADVINIALTENEEFRSDILLGGDGADTFNFLAQSSQFGNIFIGDFDFEQDKIRIKFRDKDDIDQTGSHLGLKEVLLVAVRNPLDPLSASYKIIFDNNFSTTHIFDLPDTTQYISGSGIFLIGNLKLNAHGDLDFPTFHPGGFDNNSGDRASRRLATHLSDVEKISEGLTGTEWHDEIYGLDGQDTIEGNGGNDKLFGGRDNDTIDGGEGNDTINGGSGTDTLTGGAGDDTFVFWQRSGDNDVVKDFGTGGDEIHISVNGNADDVAAANAMTDIATKLAAFNIRARDDGSGNTILEHISSGDIIATLEDFTSLTASQLEFI